MGIVCLGGGRLLGLRQLHRILQGASMGCDLQDRVRWVRVSPRYRPLCGPPTGSSRPVGHEDGSLARKTRLGSGFALG